jgi:hypothetical protein
MATGGGRVLMLCVLAVFVVLEVLTMLKFQKDVIVHGSGARQQYRSLHIVPTSVEVTTDVPTPQPTVNIYMDIDPAVCAGPVYHNDNDSAVSKPSLAHPAPSGQKFSEHMAKLSLDDYVQGLEDKDQGLIKRGTETFLFHLFDFHIQEPRVTLDEKCRPSELPNEPDCSAYPALFSGRREKPARLGLAVQLGFEVDTLEVALAQYEGLVDKFFIVEAVQTQRLQVRKPLLWSTVRNTPRFKRFNPWVVHLPLNETNMAKARSSGEGIWSVERYQERQRWREIKLWNENELFFSDDDVIGFGDVDEIPSRENLQLLKYCQLKVDKVDIGIWMTQGRIDEAFHSDFPVGDVSYTLGDPTFYKYSSALATGAPDGTLDYVSRQRGKSGPFLLGGMHMTFDGFLTARLLKWLACTECGVEADNVRHWIQLWSTNKTLELEQEMMQIPEDWHNGRVPIEYIDPRAVCIPWLLACNPNRFPVWRGEHDSRLD